MAEPAPSVLSPEWISIGRACQMLGVNPATLRQWTTTGKVRVYRTPGGHRRYSTAEIASLSQSTEEPSAGPLVQEIIGQLRARYHGMAQSATAHTSWIERLDGPTRERFHGLGDELLERLGEYLAARNPRHRQRALARGCEIAAQYGHLARKAGMDTPQSVDAYLLYRRPILDVLSKRLASHPQLSSQLGRIMRDAERFMDDVLAGVARGTTIDGGARDGE